MREDRLSLEAQRQLVQDCIRCVNAIDSRAPAKPGSAREYALLSVGRAGSLLRGFVLLFEAHLYSVASILTRSLSELAVNIGWVCEGSDKPRSDLSTPDGRALALDQDSANETRKWWEAMQATNPEIKFDDDIVRQWDRALAGAADPKIPSTYERARSIPIAREIYDFSFRGDSAATHSLLRAMRAEAQSQSPLPPTVMFHNVLSAMLLILGSAGKLLENEQCRLMTTQLQEAIRKLAGPTQGRA